MTTTAGVLLDCSDLTTVAMCRHPDCGWRTCAMSELDALRHSARHEAVAHPKASQSRDRLRRREQRAALRAVSTGGIVPPCPT